MGGGACNPPLRIILDVILIIYTLFIHKVVITWLIFSRKNTKTSLNVVSFSVIVQLMHTFEITELYKTQNKTLVWLNG